MPFIPSLRRMASLTLFLLLPALASAGDPLVAWKEIADEEGIKVFQRKVPGTSFVSFRGIGVMSSDIYDVYSVIFDIKNKTKLLSNCSKYELLKVKAPGNLVIYSRTEAPFAIISDRDSVLETKVTFAPRKTHLRPVSKGRR